MLPHSGFPSVSMLPASAAAVPSEAESWRDYTLHTIFSQVRHQEVVQQLVDFEQKRQTERKARDRTKDRRGDLGRLGGKVEEIMAECARLKVKLRSFSGTIQQLREEGAEVEAIRRSATTSSGETLLANTCRSILTKFDTRIRRITARLEEVRTILTAPSARRAADPKAAITVSKRLLDYMSSLSNHYAAVHDNINTLRARFRAVYAEREGGGDPFPRVVQRPSRPSWSSPPARAALVSRFFDGYPVGRMAETLTDCVGLGRSSGRTGPDSRVESTDPVEYAHRWWRRVVDAYAQMIDDAVS